MSGRNGSKQAHTREQLLDLIEELSVGAAIPPERRLSVDLGVSRLTLRAAIDELVREGLLVRQHGSGTYVAEPKIALPLTMTSFSEDMRRRGMQPDSRIRSFAVQPAGARGAHRLHVSPSTPVVAVERLRLADRESMAIEHLYVPQSLVPGLTAEDLEGASFYELLVERYGVTIAEGAQVIEPTVTDEEESEALSVPLHSPAFLFERVSRTETGEVVEFVRSIYRGDRYKLVTELRPPIARPARAAPADALRGAAADGAGAG